jgi:catechol 2,3-dioxygenase-like lactoylglutathione lyase family enzyme
MPQIFSRRLFLAVTGGALAAPCFSWAADKENAEDVPTLLDHILLGCNDLDKGIAFVEERTGVRAAFGGVHPGRGTRNALLSLGERRYLEIMAPDPAQQEIVHFPQIREMSDPRLVGWAAHPGDIESFAKKLREAAVAFEGPTPGSRRRPDSHVLNWKTLTLADDAGSLLPFFIEWGAGTVHPSVDAPTGCRLVRFEIVSPHPEMLAKRTAVLGLDVAVAKGEKPQLRATIAGLQNEFSVGS